VPRAAESRPTIERFTENPVNRSVLGSNRRRFLQTLAGTLAAANLIPWRATRAGDSAKLQSRTPALRKEPSTVPTVRWPKPIGSPVLDSLRPVIEHSRDVKTNIPKLIEVAQWMAYEELPVPQYSIPFAPNSGSPSEAIDFTMVAVTIDFAFTDFQNHTKFQVDYAGAHYSDSDALFACMKRALDEGTPILDGAYLATITRAQLAHAFRANIELPMLDERVEMLHQAGKILQAKYGGRYHNFVNDCSPRCYDKGNGIVERLTAEIPRFHDSSPYDGQEIKIDKLAQLGVWIMYCNFRKSGAFQLDDTEKLTAFADYIVPAALRVMNIFEYSPALDHAINTYQMIPRDSTQEVEIRAHTLYATALLREEINKIRPPDMQIIIPQIDARLWLPYHTTFWPHHLTRTIMY
jgi:Potential Queuosine, Q, salvage protein family